DRTRRPSLSSSFPLPSRPSPFPYTPPFRSSPCAPCWRRWSTPLCWWTGGPSPPLARCWMSASKPTRPSFTSWRERPSTSTPPSRSEEHTSELQSRFDIVCRLLLEKKKNETNRELNESNQDVGGTYASGLD